MKQLFCTAIVAMFAAQSIHAELLEKTKKVAGTTVQYKVVLPDGYDPAKTYPAILAFGGGPQTMNTVDSVLSRNFRAEAEKRGYIVVAPAAPDDQLFFEDGARIFPEFLKDDPGGLQDTRQQVPYRRTLQRRNRRNARRGRESAVFFIRYRVSRIMWEPTPAKLKAISKMCVFLYVGENDEYMWHPEMKREVDVLRAGGPLRAIPSRRASRTGWRRWQAPMPGDCSTILRKPRRVAVSRRGAGKQIKMLSSNEFQELRAWLAEYDAEVWDQQFHADAISGRLDAMADQAMKDFSEGRSTDL